jgi:hypothetical protein
MDVLRRVREWRASRKADREAVARAQEEARRAGDEPPQSMGEIVANVAARYPPPP